MEASMIHTATQSMKFLKLVRMLRVALPPNGIGTEIIAMGMLEKLWHITMVSAPRGDIGRLDDLAIAEAMTWPGDESQLIQIFVDCGWLDRCEQNRLVVHDWHEHAPRFIKQNIGRKGGFVSHVRKESDELQQKGTGKNPLNASSETLSGEISCAHNITQPNQTKPNKTVGEGADKPLNPAGAFDGQPKAPKKKRKPKADTEGFGEWAIPPSLDSPAVRKLLDDFAGMRRKMKKPIADFSHASTFLNNFSDVEHLTYALEFCLANRYQGLKPEYRPPKANGDGRQSQNVPKRQIITTIER
jgi:hypothetical protein